MLGTLAQSTADAERYRRHRQKTALRQSSLSQAGRELYPLPAVKSPMRRSEGLAALRRYCEIYRANTFPLAWSQDHLDFIDSLEWFASASDLVRAMDWIRTKNEPTAMKVLSINPGVDVPKDRFAFAGFKGGSEPGVMSLTWLLKTKDGAWLAVSVCWNNPEKALDDAKLVSILQATVYLLPK